jgi:hypothetical protein
MVAAPLVFTIIGAAGGGALFYDQFRRMRPNS